LPGNDTRLADQRQGGYREVVVRYDACGMTTIDYWLGLMRRLADEVRGMSAAPEARPEVPRMVCEKCGYVLLTSATARHYCPNGCGELQSRVKMP